ncbi:MAG: SpoIIE family protein phosphatase [Phycisphaeraceae bacterium]|nr:SpoIIE family protein phosphatase [Phycisphaeraceae bacterium]
MLVLIGLPTLAIYLVGLGLTLAHFSRVAKQDVEREMTRLARNYAAQFDAAFRETAAIATTTANHVSIDPGLSEEQIFELLESNVRQNDAIYGAAMAFEPGERDSGGDLYSPYVHRDGEALRRMNIGRGVYDWYRDSRYQWWGRAKQEDRGIWTDPYFDEGAGNVLMVTYSAPLRRVGAFIGVTTVDIMLPTFQDRIGRHILAEQEFAIVTRDGVFVSSTHPEDILRRSISDLPALQGRDDLEPAIERIIAGEPGVEVFDARAGAAGARRGRQWVFHAPIESTGWNFIAIVSERQALAEVRAGVALGAAALAATLALIIGAIWFIAGRITRPVERLRSTVLRVASGDLDARVEGPATGDEIGELAQSFNTMTQELRANVDRLAIERARREKFEGDLRIAREIQQGLLPRSAPKVPGFEIAGWNQPADQTGGDYYDLLAMPNGVVLVAIADVTGHGIGPALISSVCRAYLRAAASNPGAPLAGIMERINRFLYTDIPADRFVTAAIGFLDPHSRSMSLLSAGQAPLLYYEAASGEVRFWKADSYPLAVTSEIEFQQTRSIRFEPGDTLILATDGFFEWADASREMFGLDRMMGSIRRHHTLDPDSMIRAIYDDVRAHSGSTPQQDDLTAIIVKRSADG